MSTQKRWFWCAAVLFAGLCPALALTGTPPVLTNAVHSGDQFQFTLRGETNVSYIIESSSDLSGWTPVLTNSDSQATRTVVVPAPGMRTFWRVRPVPGPLFEYAIVARERIDLTGSGMINSFDSANTNYMSDGQYNPARWTDGGHIASPSIAANTVNIGNAKVAGVLSTGTEAAVTIGPNGVVGSIVWHLNTNRGIQPGFHQGPFQVVLPEAKLPADFGPASTPMAATVGGTNYKHGILVDGDYRASAITLGVGEKMLITARARLHVEGPTTLTGTGQIILGRDASIEWYAGGGAALGGGGCFNASGLAKNFSIIGLSPAPITYNGSSQLIGTIHAPLSSVTLTGTTYAIGAVVCNSFSLSGTMGIHFDENLKREGPWR